ncbi:hypothetical protein [Haloferula rosea]|uniref:Uncharacterized protein n=1 Tax=Haloferula rosea TaxID=490093 RepID=A0A934RBU4_9BACT|nr:hypothetical protein [Haloferula rosea]MBK1825741.1 hypothetical protein [Haloferula rosea]
MRPLEILCGGLVTVFLLWAWVDSRLHSSSVSWWAGVTRTSVWVSASKVEIEALEYSIAPFPRPSGLEWTRAPGTRFRGGVTSWLPALGRDEIAVHVSTSVSPVAQGFVYVVPFWLVVLVWGHLWLVISLIWRWWQRRRMEEVAS